MYGQITAWLENISATSVVNMSLANNFLAGFEQSSSISSSSNHEVIDATDNIQTGDV